MEAEFPGRSYLARVVPGILSASLPPAPFFPVIRFIHTKNTRFIIMQFKTISAFSAILLLAPALASPVATESASLDNGVVYNEGNSNYSDLLDEDSDSNLVDGIFENIPSSILEVLATAIPVSWYYDLMNPASQSSIISAASKGIYPDWYSALPTSVLAWASSAAADGDDFLFGSATASATATATASATDSASASATAVTNARSSSATITAAPSTKTTTASKTGSAEASSEAVSDAASSSASVSPSTSLSTGGAAIATGSAAMSFAGAIGLLGLAVAL